MNLSMQFSVPSRFKLKQAAMGAVLSLATVLGQAVYASDVDVPQGVLDVLNTSSEVQVIIGLEAYTQPEGELSGPAAISDQRKDISDIQDQFISELNASLSGPSHLRGGARSATPTAVADAKFTTIPYLVMTVDSHMLEKIKENDLVVSIQEDKLHSPNIKESVLVVGGDVAWAQGYSGAGQAVAIIDSGVDRNHPFLPNKVVAEACFSRNSSANGGSFSVCPNGKTATAGPGTGVHCPLGISGCKHGTHVAGIVAMQTEGGQFESLEANGVAKDASLISVQVFSKFVSPQLCERFGDQAPCALSYTSSQMMALEYIYAIRNWFDIAAVNMSLGGGKATSHCDNHGMKRLIDNLHSADIATVISSGNSGYTNAVGAPACISSAVTVGATFKDDSSWNVSNSAPMVDLLAPGVAISSSVPSIHGHYGVLATTKSGTSMAAPHVAGAFAILKSAVPDTSVDSMLNCLTETGKPIMDPRNGVVKPRIQIDAALICLGVTGEIEVSQTPLAFGTVAVGSTSEHTVEVTNTGSGMLNISAIEVTSSQFVIENNTCEDPLPAEQTCEFDVVFSPTSAGFKMGQVVITSDDIDNPTVSLMLLGQGQITTASSCTVTTETSDGGSIDPQESEATLECGNTQTYEITPDSGYELADVLLNEVSVMDDTSTSGDNGYRYTFECDCEDTAHLNSTIVAKFALNDPANSPPPAENGGN